MDDDEHVLIALERLLEGEGYRTATAWSGREALALLESADFDVLMIDEHLCDVDANTLLNELMRKQPRAFRFLLCTRKNQHELPPAQGAHTAVCKWEHEEVKSKVRGCLAA